MFRRRKSKGISPTLAMFRHLIRFAPGAICATDMFMGKYYPEHDQEVIVHGDYRSITEEQREDILTLERSKLNLTW